MQNTFTDIYAKSKWGVGSGPGSTIEFNKTTYIPFLRSFFNEHNIKSVVDLGCGDFQCGPTIYRNLDIDYKGFDTAEPVIETNKANHPEFSFTHLDFFSEKAQLPSADVCILKDVLQHWPTAHINAFLTYLTVSKKYKYILITNCGFQTENNTDIAIGKFRPLSSKFEPLSHYKAEALYHYNKKEVCLITTTP